jgi:hypothetical protein
MIRANRKRRLLMHMALNNLLARRRQLLCVCYVMLMFTARRNVVARVPRLRSRRRYIRNTDWWQKVWNTYSDARFKKTFRVTRGT